MACWSAQNFCKINGQQVQNNPIDVSLSSITQYETPVTDTFWNRIHTVLKNIYNYGRYGTRNPAIKGEVEVWYKEYLSCSQRTEIENPYSNCSGYYAEYYGSGSYGGGYYGGYYGGSGGYDSSGQYRIYKTTRAVDGVTDVKDGDPILQLLYNKILSLISVSNVSGQPIITKAAMDQLQQQINTYNLNWNRCNDCNTSCNVGCEVSCECEDEDNQTPPDCGQGGGGSGGSCVGTMYYFYAGNGSCSMSGASDSGNSTGICGWYAGDTQ